MRSSRLVCAESALRHVRSYTLPYIFCKGRRTLAQEINVPVYRTCKCPRLAWRVAECGQEEGRVLGVDTFRHSEAAFSEETVFWRFLTNCEHAIDETVGGNYKVCKRQKV